MISNLVRCLAWAALLLCVYSTTANARYVDKQIQQCQPQQVCHPVQRTEQQCAPSQVCQQVPYQTQQCIMQQQCSTVMQSVSRCIPQTRCNGNRCQTFQSCVNVQVPQQICQPRQVCQPTTAYRQVCNTVQKCQPRNVTSQECKSEQQCKMVTQRVWEADAPTTTNNPISAPSSPKQNAPVTTTTSTFLPSPSTANVALARVSTNAAVTTRNAATTNGYIYPKGTSGATPTTGLSQQQCAALVQALRPDVKETNKWTPIGQTPENPRGQSVQNANLQPGTPIATFTTNGKYPTGSQTMDTAPYYSSAPKEPHSGIFMDYIRDASGRPIGFEMLAQSAGQPATIEKRLFAPVPSSSPYSGIQVENYQYSAISASTQ